MKKKQAAVKSEPLDIFQLTFEERNELTKKKFLSSLVNNKTIILDDFGLYIEYEKWMKNSQVYVPYKQEILYKWNSFNIIEKYNMFIGTGEEWRINFELDGKYYQNHNIQKLKKRLFQKFQGSKGHNHITNVLDQYLEDITDITITICPIIGFTNEGWKLPPKCVFIRDQGALQEIIQNVKIMNNIQTDEKTAIKFMKQIYDATTIPYKDIIFAYSIIAPFLYALRKYTRLIPILALGGKGGKGKSTFLELITCKYWNHINAIIGPGTMASPPRAEAYFASSTFPICLDEAQDLKPFATGMIKTYTCSEDYFRRLNPDHSYKFNIPYSAPITENFNELPIQFDSSAYRDRTVYLEINEIKKNPDWVEIYNSIISGYIGKYIIDLTSNFDGEEIYTWYKEANALGFTDDREKIIAKTFSAGADMMKAIFGIELDLSELPQKIKETHELGNDDLIELISYQIAVGVAGEVEYFSIDPTTGIKTSEIKNEFKYRKGSWVHYEIFTGRYKNQNGYYITVNNKSDLEKQYMSFRSFKRLSLDKLTKKLQDSWKEVNYGPHMVNGRKQKAIFIPSKYITEKYGSLVPEE